jgi:hypothetical protein
MNKNHIGGRCGGMSWHNTAKSIGEAVEVNVAVVRRRTVSLPGEISIARGRESGSAVRSNALGDDREVSRGHSTEIVNRGAERCPFKLRNSQAQLRKDRTGSMIRPELLSKAMNPTGGADNGEDSGREREIMRQRCCSERRGSARSLLFGVTYDGRNRRATDPYGRWCGGSGFNPRFHPMRQLLHQESFQ